MRYYIATQNSRRGKFVVGRYARSYATYAEAKAMMDDLEEHGSCGPQKIVDKDGNEVSQ